MGDREEGIEMKEGQGEGGTGRKTGTGWRQRYHISAADRCRVAQAATFLQLTRTNFRGERTELKTSLLLVPIFTHCSS